jgi:hypothetical protein
MSTKALKANNAAVMKSPRIAKPNFHDLTKAGDRIIELVDQLDRMAGLFERHDPSLPACEAGEVQAHAEDLYRTHAPTIASFKRGVEAYNVADDEELVCFIAARIAKMIGSCAVAPHSPAMYASVMTEAIMEARTEDDMGDEFPPMPIAIEGAFREVIRQTNKTNFAPSLPVVLETLNKQQLAWRKRLDCAERFEPFYDDLMKLIDGSEK